MRLKEIDPGGRPGHKVTVMPKTKGIEYIVDEKGRKKSVVMSYKAYMELMEDFADLRVMEQRRDEPTVSLDTVIAEMKDAGRLPADS